MSKYIVTVDKNLINLYHSGIKGMKWGRRRYQNEDGSLTEAGRKRYGVGDGDSESKGNSSKSQSTDNDSNKGLIPYRQVAERKGSDNGGDKGVIPYRQVAERKGSDNGGDKGVIPYRQVAERNNSGNLNEKTHFKPGDDDYEIKDAPKTNSDPGRTSKPKPEDIYSDDFEDITNGRQNKIDKTKTGKDEVAEKNRKEEEAEKNKNAEEREKNKEEREKEEAEAHKRAEERRKEAEQEALEEIRDSKQRAKEREKNKEEREKEEAEAHKRAEERRKEAEKEALDEMRKAREQEIKNLRGTKQVVDESAKISNELANMAGKKSINVPRMNLSGLTNKQMKDAIQREIIEKQYDSMFNTQRHKAEAGRERTQNFLKNVGSGLTITGSALAIALTIKQLRG